MSKKKSKLQVTLKKFLKTVLRTSTAEPDWLSDPYSIIRSIPKELLAEDEPSGALGLLRDLSPAYRECLVLARKDLTTEHLTDKELKDRFWFLFCDVSLHRDLYKNLTELEDRIQQFMDELYRPIQEFEVLIRILNFDSTEYPLTIWDFTINTFSRSSLEDMGLKGDDKRSQKLLDEYSEQPVMVFSETGNNTKLVIERAREKARFNLKILQTYLIGWLGTHDENLLYDLSEFTIIRLKGDSEVHYAWERKRESFKMTCSRQNLTKCFEEFEQIEKLQPKIRTAVERSIFWIGTAVEEKYFDQKVIFLCTSMETLLTVSNDGRKGEALAYRMILLMLSAGEGFPDPFKLFRVYALRSEVVHGSAHSICTKADYTTALWAAREILSQFLDFVTQNNFNAPSEVIRALEQSEHVSSVIEWLGKSSAKAPQAIREALEKATGK